MSGPMRAALLILSILAAGPWEYRPGLGFVNTSTMQQLDTPGFLELGRRLAQEGRTEEALEVLGVLVEAPVDAGPREEALFLRGRILADARRFEEAYFEFDRFTRLFPESPLAARAREALMATALDQIRVGATVALIFTSRVDGLKRLRDTLQRFPREEFSDDYYLLLARWFLEQANLADAETELKTVLELYRGTDSAPRALLLLAELGRRRFEGVDYDSRPLLESKRYYEQFLGDYPRLADQPGALRALNLDAGKLEAMTEDCRQGMRWILDRLAEKELAMARYYVGRGRPKSARLYLENLLKRYPESSFAEEARQLLAETAE